MMEAVSFSEALASTGKSAWRQNPVMNLAAVKASDLTSCVLFINIKCFTFVSQLTVRTALGPLLRNNIILCR